MSDEAAPVEESSVSTMSRDMRPLSPELNRFGGGGAGSGSTSFKFEAASQTAMGELLDRMMGDSDYQGLMARLNAEDAPSVLGQITGFNVLDVGLAPGTPGRVGTLVAWQPAADRTEDAIALAVDAANVLAARLTAANAPGTFRRFTEWFSPI